MAIGMDDVLDVRLQVPAGDDLDKEADLFRRLERRGEATEAYRRALAKVRNQAERAYLAGRLAEMEGS